MVELIPGTSLPIMAPLAAPQPEGRGGVQLTDARQPPSMIDPETSGDPDGLTLAQRTLVETAVRAFDRRPQLEQTFFVPAADQTDATTGNMVLQLFEAPAGTECHLSSLLIDTPSSATITPVAPFANASVWAMICVGPPSSSDNDTVSITSLREGMVAFAPTSSGGPILPGLWTFNDSNAPIARGGEQFYYVLSGASIAGILNVRIRCRARINLYRSGGRA